MTEAQKRSILLVEDEPIGRDHREGPVVQLCLSGGLWDAGASITVGNRHIANWLIGQLRDETQSEEAMRAYACEIGADEERFMNAFYLVPAMSGRTLEREAGTAFILECSAG
jgi:ligand-binding sensor protein